MGTKLVTENIVKLSPSGSKAARGGRYNIETGAWKKIRILHHIVNIITRSEAPLWWNLNCVYNSAE